MNILVTAIGSFSADCVINSLKNEGHKVVGCDIYPSNWHAVSKDCDNVYQAPFATKEDEYISFLLTVSKKENIECIFPLTDLEIDILNQNRQKFIDANIALFIQSENCLNIARDKFEMYKLFKDDKNVNVPFSVHSEELTLDFPLPAIAKPVNGRSSEGLQRITQTKELANIKTKNNYIVQQAIEGSVFTVDYVRDCFNNDFAIPREELLRTKNGAGTTIRIVPDELLRETTSYIGKKLDIRGCVNMEFIYNAGKYFLIDINPRFSAGVAFSNYIGYNMVISHLNAFIGKEICTSISYSEQIICKRYKEELLWINK
ncbi:MAG: ATP-grasp domain-containing protein [Alistipes sp.]|nr:ATP-grasp domain-containing protein [Alistipes sp.]